MTRKLQSRSNWPAKAARVGGLLSPERFHPAALAFAERGRPAGPWCVGFSGGADSLALLLLLWAHWPARRGRLVALHFNHRLRGRAATTDAQFCLKVCRALGVRCRVGEWRGVHRKVGEAEARAARHAFFAREMKKLGARILWLAHQQDDVAETLLMRLARGSGAGGLAAPRPVQSQADGRVHLRPLLTLKKAELVAALRTTGAGWREDASNAGDNYFRNRIRRSVLPSWAKAAGRDALAGAALARERLDEDNAALEAWLDQLAPVKRRQLDLAKLAGLPRALWRRALHRWLLAAEPATDLSRQGFERLLEMAERGCATRFSLGTSGFAVLRAGKMVFQKR